jgi:uncharacterized protein YegJ (DUF2314 family)
MRGWVWIVIVIAAILLLLVARAVLRNRRKGKMTALVLFLKEPRAIDAQAVRRAATKAFGVRVGSTPDEENFVIQLSPETMPVRINGLPLGFICAQKSYMDPKPPQESLNGLDIRIAKMIADHRAWISLDLIQEIPPAMKPEAYRHIARLLAEFIDDNCLGIYCPEEDEMMFNHPNLKNELRGENPLEALQLKDVPIVQADYDDPKLKATIDEAQQRWPEFVAAFAKKRPVDRFGVKLRFADGDQEEFMWIVVDSIDGDSIKGVLDNSPNAVKNVKSGDTVNTTRRDVLDWAYTTDEDDEICGGFSLKVLTGEKA